MHILAMIYKYLMLLSEYLWSYVGILLLLGAGIYFTIKTGFVQFRYFFEQFRLLVDKENFDQAQKTGGISSFGAFCISTASRVGTGNIAGIALAVAGGGPGAIFWMWIIAIIGSASAFVEATLAQIFKVKNGHATKGGPAYYMEQGLNARWAGIIFAVLITITYAFVFNAVQANTMSLILDKSFSLTPWITGGLVALITSAVIFGGVQRISKVSEVIVPVFAVLYILVALIIVGMHITEIPKVLQSIVVGAFNPQQFVAGSGAGIMVTVMTGAKRGMFSNEAGMGSAPNASATADVNHPVAQGLIQSLGVFTDTIVICTATALMILLYNGYATSSNEGILLTQEALSSYFGPTFGTIFLSICIVLFAFSSILGNYYYGESNIQFIFENRPNAEKKALKWLRICVCLCVFIGSFIEMKIIWNLADLFMVFMTIENMIAILFLGKFAFAALADYRNQKTQGINKPQFYQDTIPELKDIIQEWPEQK